MLSRTLVVCAVLCTPAVALASKALDEPIPRTATFEDLMRNLDRVERHLEGREMYAFRLASAALLDPVRFDSHLTQPERDRAAVAAFAGLTPRQVILLGHEVRIVRAAAMATKGPDGKKESDIEIKDSEKIIREFTIGTASIAGVNPGAAVSTQTDGVP